MQDLFKSYKKHQLKTQLWVLSISAFLAFSINSLFLQDINTSILKASVLDLNNTSITEEEKADITLNIENNILSLVTTNSIENVTELSFSLLYDPNVLEFSEKLQEGITIISETPGIATFILSYNTAQNIQKSEKIIDIIYSKLEDKTVYLNMSNVNFKDITWEVYLLSSQGIIF